MSLGSSVKPPRGSVIGPPSQSRCTTGSTPLPVNCGLCMYVYTYNRGRTTKHRVHVREHRDRGGAGFALNDRVQAPEVVHHHVRPLQPTADHVVEITLPLGGRHAVRRRGVFALGHHLYKVAKVADQLLTLRGRQGRCQRAGPVVAAASRGSGSGREGREGQESPTRDSPH